MDSTLAHKGYYNIVKCSPDNKLFHGKTEAISDRVTFEGGTAKEIRLAFAEAVESYSKTCGQVGKTLAKPHAAKPELTQTPSPARPCASSANAAG